MMMSNSTSKKSTCSCKYQCKHSNVHLRYKNNTRTRWTGSHSININRSRYNYSHCSHYRYSHCHYGLVSLLLLTMQVVLVLTSQSTSTANNGLISNSSNSNSNSNQWYQTKDGFKFKLLSSHQHEYHDDDHYYYFHHQSQNQNNCHDNIQKKQRSGTHTENTNYSRSNNHRSSTITYNQKHDKDRTKEVQNTSITTIPTTTTSNNYYHTARMINHKHNKSNKLSQIMKRIQKGHITIDFGSYVHHDDDHNKNKTLLQRLQTPQQHLLGMRQLLYRHHHHHDHHHNTQSQTQSQGSSQDGYQSQTTTDTNHRRSNNKNNSSSRSSSSKTQQHHGYHNNHDYHHNHQSSQLNHYINPKNTKIRMTVDPSAIGRLGFIFICAATSFGSAFMGTLRLLAPLVVSRRVLVFIGTLVSDWYAGRYFRKTFTRMEKLYIHYYEAPAIFRAISRSSSQIIVYLSLARIMGWLVGITHPPCRSEGRGLAFFCGLLWLGSVVGTGHAFSTAISLWGGPLRLQAANHPTRTSVKTILLRPWHILQWLQNPEQWISLLATPERRPFDPNPITFPATWSPLRLLQMIAVAKIAATEPSNYFWCDGNDQSILLPRLIKQYLIQLALCDEWCRVFLKEKRLGLGIFVACAYSAAMISLIVTSVCIDEKMSLLMIPSLLALIVSTWLNLVIYCNRYTCNRKRRKPTVVVTPINSLL